MLDFIDDDHQEFYKEICNEMSKIKKLDRYEKALIYTLGISEITREHFNEIFNFEDGINVDAILCGWQTGTSLKVTRMAFNLYNYCMYDSEEDIENGQISEYYNPSDIFACSYAPYFFEAIKIRFPEYMRIIPMEKDVNIFMYARYNGDDDSEEEERL